MPPPFFMQPECHAALRPRKRTRCEEREAPIVSRFSLLASGDLFKRKFVRIVGSTLGEKRLTVETLNEIDSQIQHVQFDSVPMALLVAAVALVSNGLEGFVLTRLHARSIVIRIDQSKLCSQK